MALVNVPALLQASSLAVLGFLLTVWFVPMSEFELKDYLFPVGIFLFIYLRARNYGGDDENKDGISGDAGAEEEDEVASPPCPSLDGVEVCRGRPMGKAPSDEGVVLIVFVFTTWCDHCRKAWLPLLNVLRYAEGNENRGAAREVRMLALSKEDPSSIRTYLMTLGKRMGEIIPGLSIGSDTGAATDALGKMMKASTVPHAYIIDDYGAKAGAGKGIVEWDGHPTHVEAALTRILRRREERRVKRKKN